jgi:signal transduction histidine kinase
MTISTSPLRPGPAATLALRRPAESLDGLLDALPFAVLAVDGGLVVTAANREGRRLLGGLPAGCALPEPWMDFSLRRFAARLCTAGAVAAEARVRVEGGRVVELLGAPRGDGAVVVIRDVTGQAADEEADRAFVANAAHELRGSLGAIGAAVDALELGAKEEPQDRDYLLAGVAREVAALRREVDALLVLARAHAEPRALRAGPVRLAPLLAEVAGSLPLGDVSVRTTCDEGTAVRAVAPLLEIALRNLLRNAAHHAREGRIALTARRVVRADAAAGEAVAVEVADDGPGIPPDVRRRVFERFAASDRGTGFGIGLPLTREIAHVLGGDVEIDSDARGTVVRLVLPAG